MKNRLAYLCSSKSWGGLEMNHLRNAVWMSKRGHSVIVIGLSGSLYQIQAEEMGLSFIEIKPYRKYYDRKGAKELKTLLKSESVTHLIIRSNYDMCITASVKRSLNDHLHTSYFMEMQIGVKKTGLLHTLRYRQIDLWSCPLNWLSNQVKEMTRFKNELIVIPSGLDLSNFEVLPNRSDSRTKLELKNDETLLGLIGRFDPQKGQLLLLEAMTKCRNNNFSVVFLGEPTMDEGVEYANSMNRFIKDHGLEKRVSIRGFRKDISTFYSAVDWIVMATKAETFGMVTIEAFACGTPVLGSNAGGTPELLENEYGGRLFESMNSTDLARKIDNIVSNMNFPDSEKLKTIAKKFDHNLVCLTVEKALHLN